MRRRLTLIICAFFLVAGLGLAFFVAQAAINRPQTRRAPGNLLATGCIDQNIIRETVTTQAGALVDVTLYHRVSQQ